MSLAPATSGLSWSPAGTFRKARARQVLAALEQRMRDVGLELHPGKTRIVYFKDWKRRGPWDGPVSFDFLGYTFRPRDTMGKNGRFTGFDLAVGPKAVKG